MRNAPNHSEYAEVCEDSIKRLSWDDQVDTLVRHAEEAEERSSAADVMQKAVALGFLQEYRPGKWKPAKGKKGGKGKAIIDAYIVLPKVCHRARPAKTRDSLQSLAEGLHEIEVSDMDHEASIALIRKLVLETKLDA